MQDFINTYCGISFYPLNPQPEDVHIEDIAHALSHMTRANGHLRIFFSVAQHCINCMREAEVREFPLRIQFACLLHDASEAYLSDITRPVKHHLREYLSIEKRLQDAIYARFGLMPLTDEERAMIDDIDDTMLYQEFYQIEGVCLFAKELPCQSHPDFLERPFSEVKQEFLRQFKRLEAALAHHVT